MAVALDMQSADFEERFAALVAAKRETSADVELTVADIIDDDGLTAGHHPAGDAGAGREPRPHQAFLALSGDCGEEGRRQEDCRKEDCRKEDCRKEVGGKEEYG